MLPFPLLAATASAIAHLASASEKKVIVQMFEWTFDSVAAECGYFLGKAGVGYVQVSPAQENYNAGGPWWDSYQPVGYNIASKLGNRTQFGNMVETCHQHGVKVIVDTVMNHCAGVASGTGYSGNRFTKYVYPGTYQWQDFHHSQCGTWDGSIHNYGNSTEVQFCELVGLADLATETEWVRSRLATFINDLVDLGVDGLRLDAAKHMPSADIANILSRVKKPLYITQEFIWGAGEPMDGNAYIRNGNVQEFRFVDTTKDAFSRGDISYLGGMNNWGWIASSDANAFVANHDTERNGASLNYKSPNNQYTLAHIFALSFPYGRPTILSSYLFDNTDQGGPNGGYGTCYGPGGVNGWLCQHRWKGISGLIGFFNQVGDAPVVNWVSDAAPLIAYGRGALGSVVINTAWWTWSRAFPTSLPDGQYCDIANGDFDADVCTGPTVTVRNGAFTASVNGNSALAIHLGSKIVSVEEHLVVQQARSKL